jgi:nucleoside-diphosphate-sugar epimerase
VREAASSGIRSAVLCNSLIYGTGLGLAKDSVQVPPLVAQGRASGTVRTVGPGKNVWSNVHLDDVLDLYELALERAPPGAFYFVENGEASFEEIGQAIARRFHLKGPEPWSVDEAAAAWGGMKAAYSLGSNSRVRGFRAREELGWAPKHRSVTTWIEREMEVTLP